MSKNHYELLKRCSDKKNMTDWNLYRLHHPNEKIDLKFISLENFYLLEADLKDINLQWTSLKKTKMNGVDAEKSKLLSRTTLVVFSSFFFILFFTVFYFFDYSLSSFQFENYNSELNALSSAIFIQTMFVVGLSASGISLNNKVVSIFLGIPIVGILVMLIFGTPIYYAVYWIFDTNTAWTSVSILFFFLMLAFSYEYYKEQQKSIRHCKNPLAIINFNSNYLLDESEVTRLKDELSRIDSQENVQEQLEQELNEDDTLDEETRKSFQFQLDDLQKQELERQNESEFLKSRIDILEKEELEAKLIKVSMDTIKEAFSHIKKTEKSLFLMSIIYGVLLLGGLIMLGYFGYLSYEHREEYFFKLKDISISASLGIVIFYATPILFAFSIIIFGISNLNKNIEAKEKLLQKRYLIDLLEATFYAQIKIGSNSKEALQKLINKLSESAYEQLISIEKENPKKEKKKRYQEKITDKRIDGLIQSLIKKI